MAYKNLKSFINNLEKEDELAIISIKVSPQLEMTEINDRIVKNSGKALLFENNGTQFPVLLNAFGSEKRMCLSLGVNNLDEIGEEITNIFSKLTSPKNGLLDKLSMLPLLKEISSWMPHTKKGRGACQEVVMQNPDLTKLPILTCWPFDGGPFITLPMVHTKDPETGIRNLGMYRMQVFDSKTSGMHWHIHKNSARHFRAYKALGKRMPVAVALGGDPVLTYSATAPMPDNLDEYMLAGFLRKKRVELVKCLTVDIEVPADAEIIIEGFVDPNEDFALEGPFGDHTGYYSLADYYPKFHVTAITHQKNAIYPATVVGIAPQEDSWLGKATERIFLAPLRLAMLPEVIDMSLPDEGGFHNIAIIKIKKEWNGQAQKVMNSLWGAGQMMFNKIMIVVNEDIDIHNYSEVLKAIMSIDPKKNTIITTGPADVLDHASKEFVLGGKIGIDATDVNITEKQIIFPKVVFIKNKKAGEVRKLSQELIDENQLKKEKIVLFLNDISDKKSWAEIAWRVSNNIDPSRDCFFIDDCKILFVDGTDKPQHLKETSRDWPNIVTMNRETIEKVDNLWSDLGLGDFLESPSKKYSNNTEGAINNH